MLGSLLALLVPLFLWLAPPQLSDVIEQPAIDTIASVLPPPATDRVVVIDIDSGSLEAFEGRRLSRPRLAELIGQLTFLGAASVALDLVLEAPCEPGQAGIQHLETAIGSGKVTTGFLLSASPTEPPPVRSPVAIDADVRLPLVWRALGAETSCTPLTDAAAGLSSISLAGDFDALVRRVPAVVTVADRAYPSLGVDALRLAEKAGAVFLLGQPPRLRIGRLQTHIDSGGNLNIRPATAEQQDARTISASDILERSIAADRIAAKIVFVGSSAAELGGLRPVPGDPVRPSVQIHADLATNLLLGSAPMKPDWARWVSFTAACALGIIMAFTVAITRPMIATGIGAIALLGWISACIVAHHGANIVLAPVLPVLAMATGAFAGSAIQFSAVRFGEAVIRQRFEQRLPATVVRQLVAEPDLLKLQGEQRVATSLFTDVEGFTTTTEKITPVELIGLLDRYFEGLTAIITRHGGMVDKTIGDGMHALFNAPVDLEGHADAAIACAREILSFSEDFRSSGLAYRVGFGRTRIGVETGKIILGDVGGSGKIDYAAFGSTINIAARLQDANKRFGTSILIGPGTRTQAKAADLRELGDTELRGIGILQVFTIT